MTADVVSWLTATLDEVEREAREEKHDATPDDYGFERCDLAGRHPIADDTCTCGLDQRRPGQLAAVEADRAILAVHAPEPDVHWSDGVPTPTGSWVCQECLVPDDEEPGWPCRTVLLVASRYRHRPGYQEELWAP